MTRIYLQWVHLEKNLLLLDKKRAEGQNVEWLDSQKYSQWNRTEWNNTYFSGFGNNKLHSFVKEHGSSDEANGSVIFQSFR